MRETCGPVRDGLDGYRNRYALRVQKLKDALVSEIGGNRQTASEMEVSKEGGETPPAIDELVSLTANAQAEVFEQCLHGILKLESSGRDSLAVFKAFERYASEKLTGLAIEMADYGIRGESSAAREKQLQVLGAYARVHRMVGAAEASQR